MPILKSKIEQKRLTAEIKELPGMAADISPAEKLEVEISHKPKFSARWKNKKLFGGFVSVLDIVLRFLDAKGRFWNKHKATASFAPAVDAGADTAFQTTQEATPAAQPAEGIEVYRIAKMNIVVALVAYRRAGCVFVREMFIKRKSGAIAARGAVAEYRKNMELHRITKAEAAGSATTESHSTFATANEATATPAPAQTVPAIDDAFQATNTAQAGKAAVTGANINGAFRVGYRAAIASWFLPEQDGNSLYIFQSFSGIQSGNVLEVDMEENSTYWANAVAKNGVLHLAFAETVTQTGNTLEVS